MSMEFSQNWPLRSDRVPLMRPVRFEVLTPLEETAEPNAESRSGQAVLLNISQGGMLLLTGRAISADVPLLVESSVFRDVLQVSGLSEAVWTCPLFLSPHLHFVGLRFLQ
jgi:hypothetical protein